MPDPITVTLVCFSQVRHLLGADSVSVELPVGSTAADAEDELRSRLPEQARSLPLRVAINKEFADRITVLRDGDEVVFLPPMQGG